MSPEEFVTFLRDHRIRRFYFVWDPAAKMVKTSHPVLQPLADFLQNDRRDFAAHEGIFLQVTKNTDVIQAAFIHDTHRGQAQGGTRFWTYDSMEEFLRDGLRLSKGMTQKNALAGLWWGGGKGVITQNPNVDTRDAQTREEIFHEYGELVSSLKGCYITAEDVGTTPADIARIFERTRFTTCIPAEWGGSGNPSPATAAGVVKGMDAAVKYLDGGSITGRKIVVQGLGHVADALIGYLLERGVGKVVACDIRQEQVEAARNKFGQGKYKGTFEARLVEKGDTSILFEECDILAPCATGGILNAQTIPNLRTKIVCGAANNQLEDVARDDAALMERGILYVPDFLVNRMGIVNCSNEQYGRLPNDPLITRHLGEDWNHSVYQTTLQVLELSKKDGQPPAKTAVKIADELAREEHPIFGHRGNLIIEALMNGGWAE